MLDSQIKTLIKQERLPASFTRVVEEVYLPIGEKLNRRFSSNSKGHIIGINGCPGSGKSTMALFLKAILESHHKRSVEIISIDDFYKTKQERNELAASIHPLFKTRGVPGTHDTLLANETLKSLKVASKERPCLIPRFNKAEDDRYSIDQWQSVDTTPDIIIFEGWCIAAQAQTEEELSQSINLLEQEHDTDALWRSAVNSKLQNKYRQLFSKLEYLIVLQPATPEIVLKWRIQQEEKLRDKLLSDPNPSDSATVKNASPVGMTDKELITFVMHYERLIRHMHINLPSLADILLNLDDKRAVTKLTIKD
jgi:D-glycerate 3-kinase